MLEEFKPLEHGNTDFADVVALGHPARAVFDRGKATRLRAERILESSKACQLHSEFLFPAASPLASASLRAVRQQPPLRSSFFFVHLPRVGQQKGRLAGGPLYYQRKVAAACADAFSDASKICASIRSSGRESCRPTPAR